MHQTANRNVRTKKRPYGFFEQLWEKFQKILFVESTSSNNFWRNLDQLVVIQSATSVTAYISVRKIVLYQMEMTKSQTYRNCKRSFDTTGSSGEVWYNDRLTLQNKKR